MYVYLVTCAITTMIASYFVISVITLHASPSFNNQSVQPYYRAETIKREMLYSEKFWTGLLTPGMVISLV